MVMPASPTAQQFTIPQQGTADANGNLEIVFPLVPQSFTQTGSLQIPGSRADVKWSAAIGSAASGASNGAGAWFGSTTLDNVQCPGGSQVIVTATNLDPGTNVTAFYVGSMDSADLAPIVAPHVTANVSTTAESVLVASGALTAGGLLVIRTQPSWRSVRVWVNQACPVIQIQGEQSGATYATGPVAAPVNGPSFIGSIVEPTVDLELEVSIAISVNPTSYWVVAQLTDSVVEVENTQDEPLFAVPIRSDGRAFPLGTHAVRGGITAVGTGNLIAAPGAGLHILLSHLHIGHPVTVSSTGEFDVIATINGAAAPLMVSYQANAGVIPAPPFDLFDIPDQGLLLDANTALTYNLQVAAASVGAWNITGLYDIVA